MTSARQFSAQPFAQQPARFYPIVPDVAWLRRIVPLGIATVQLRMKGCSSADVRRAIDEALIVTRDAGCQLIVNDFWREALDAGADFVHLGQEDLAAADLVALRSAGIKIGISTHDQAELAVALAANADYVALGPIYETKLKAMRWSPQGLEKLSHWKAQVGATPLVAIGGITPDRAQGVWAAGADSVAVITDFIAHANPQARIRDWVALTQRAGTDSG